MIKIEADRHTAGIHTLEKNTPPWNGQWQISLVVQTGFRGAKMPTII